MKKHWNKSIIMAVLVMSMLTGCGDKGPVVNGIEMGERDKLPVDIMGVRYYLYSEGYADIYAILNPNCVLSETITYEGKEYEVLRVAPQDAMFNWVGENTSPEVLDLPDSILTISNLDYCLSKEIILPENLISIGGMEFCSNIESIEFPDSIEKFSCNEFFSYCSNLKTVTIPESAEKLLSGDHMFNECTSLESITIPGDMEWVGSSMFSGCTALKDVVLEDGITSVGSTVFKNCYALEEVIFPDSITTMQDRVFENCPNLKHVYLSDNQTDVPPHLFKANVTDDADVSGLTIHVKESLVEYVQSLYPTAAVVAK